MQLSVSTLLVSMWSRTVLVVIADGPHACWASMPISLFKITSPWCEQFCLPEKEVPAVKQFGDVHEGKCADKGYNHFDHSQSLPGAYGVSNFTADMYERPVGGASGTADGPHACWASAPISLFKITSPWCEQFCLPEKEVPAVKQFGDVHEGKCADKGYNHFDHSQSLPGAHGVANFTADMYEKMVGGASGTADGPYACWASAPISLFKITNPWCEQFCLPEKEVPAVKQFGDVREGQCADKGYNLFDHSQSLPGAYGVANFSADMYKKAAFGMVVI